MLLKFTTEKEWLEARKQDITSTDIASLFGINPYKSRLKLWMIKSGQIEDDFEETRYTVWGKRLQSVIGQGISEDQGWECYDLSGYYLRDPEARIGASMDFRVVCPTRGKGLLETKSTGFFQEEDGWLNDKSPLAYEMQLQTQVCLAIQEGQDITWGGIGALDGRKNTRVYERNPDMGFFDLAKEEARKFWRSIELNEPPAPDYAVDKDLLQQLQGKIDIGRNVSLTGNNRAQELIVKYDELGGSIKDPLSVIKSTKLEMDKIETEIHHIMGSAEIALIGDYIVKAPIKYIDERLQKEYNYRVFNLSKRKTGRKG